MVGFHLHLIQFWPLNLKSIENMAIQQNICLYTFAQCWKTKLRRTKLQRYLHIGLTRAKGLRNKRTKVYQGYSKTYKELITGTLNSLLYVRGDLERSDYKPNRNMYTNTYIYIFIYLFHNNRNIDQQIDNATMLVSRIILLLLN